MSKRTKKQNKSHNKFCRNLLEHNDNKCYICGLDIDYEDVTKDHVLPKSFGFSKTHNLMPAHLHCNRSKDNRLPTVTELKTAILYYRKTGNKFLFDFS